VRINIPTNLRRREDLAMPAANVMSFTFVDRHARQCRNHQALLQSIRVETEAIKQGRLGLYFIAQLALMAGIPGVMPLVLGRHRCLATAVLTNVGDLARLFSSQFPQRAGKLVIGNLVLESLSGTPPLRPQTRLGVGVITYAGQMSLSLLADRHHFTQEQSRRFLNAYVARVRQSLATIAPEQVAPAQDAQRPHDAQAR
jgi:hypothetical protein